MHSFIVITKVQLLTHSITVQEKHSVSIPIVFQIDVEWMHTIKVISKSLQIMKFIL